MTIKLDQLERNTHSSLLKLFGKEEVPNLRVHLAGIKLTIRYRSVTVMVTPCRAKTNTLVVYQKSVRTHEHSSADLMDVIEAIAYHSTASTTIRGSMEKPPIIPWEMVSMVKNGIEWRFSR